MIRAIRHVVFIGVFCAVMPSLAIAQAAKKTDADKANEDIAAHRIIARAHENAAKCLEEGKGEKICHEQLAQACKGVAIGKHCGMRHKH